MTDVDEDINLFKSARTKLNGRDNIKETKMIAPNRDIPRRAR